MKWELLLKYFKGEKNRQNNAPCNMQIFERSEIFKKEN